MHGFFGKQLYAVDEKPFKEVLADISLVCHELPVDELHECLIFEGLPVILTHPLLVSKCWILALHF